MPISKTSGVMKSRSMFRMHAPYTEKINTKNKQYENVLLIIILWLGLKSTVSPEMPSFIEIYFLNCLLGLSIFTQLANIAVIFPNFRTAN